MRQFSLPSLRAIAFGLFAIAAFAAGPRDAAAQGGPDAFINNLGQQGLHVVGPNIPKAQRVARFRQLLDSDFDMAGIAQFVLGAAGRNMTPPQRQEFTTAFREYLAQSYADRLARYAGEAFRVTGTRPYGGETVVMSQVIPRGGAPLQMEWHVVDHGGRFLVTDVLVDGVSMKATQRNEFAAIIQRNGGNPQALIAALRQETGLERGYGSSR